MNILMRSISKYSRKWEATTQSSDRQRKRSTANKILVVSVLRITKFSCKWEASTRSDRKGNVLLCTKILAVSVSILMHLLFVFFLYSSDSFCEGRVLDAVQRARLYKDSKTFVDMPLRYSPGKQYR